MSGASIRLCLTFVSSRGVGAIAEIRADGMFIDSSEMRVIVAGSRKPIRVVVSDPGYADVLTVNRQTQLLTHSCSGVPSQPALPLRRWSNLPSYQRSG